MVRYVRGLVRHAPRGRSSEARSAERVALTEPSPGAPSTPTRLASATSSHLPRARTSLILIVSGFTAYWTMFSQYHIYDDEGYHLWSLRLFADGHSLYNSVFSYYGPFHYELWGGLSRLIGVSFLDQQRPPGRSWLYGSGSASCWA